MKILLSSKKMINNSPSNENVSLKENSHTKNCPKQITQFPKIDYRHLALNSSISFGQKMEEHLGYGARYLGNNKTKFKLLAPDAKKVSVKVADKNYNFKKEYELQKNDKNEFEITANGVAPKDKYIYQIENKKGQEFEIFDPVADYLPEDIVNYKEHSDWAEIVNHKDFQWTDDKWVKGVAHQRLTSFDKDPHVPAPATIKIIHIGQLGGFEKAKKEIDKIKENKIFNTVQLMPIGEFYGEHNWGYDGVGMYAPESSYGSPDDFKGFVDYAHKNNINVFLDVVPNHFGSIGNHMNKIGPAVSGEKNEWGDSLNFEGPDNKYIRKYMTNMIMNWAVNYHIDGFRLDATQKIKSDDYIKELMKEVRGHKETKNLIIYAEDLRKEKTTANRFLGTNISKKNFGMDGQIAFDFHKSVMTLAANKQIHGMNPSLSNLEQSYKKGFIEINGNEETPHPSLTNFIVGISNNDEIGNDEGGKRNLLTILASEIDLYSRFEDDNLKETNKFLFDTIKNYTKTGEIIPENKQKEIYKIKQPISQEEFDVAFKKSKEQNKLALGAMFLYPGPKSMFMGDERAEMAPFKFYAQFPNSEVNKDTKQTIQEEIEEQKGYKVGKESFKDSNLYTPDYNIKKLNDETLSFVKDLSEYVRKSGAFEFSEGKHIECYRHENDNLLEVRRWNDYGDQVVALLNFSDTDFESRDIKSIQNVNLKEVINSNDKKYGGNNAFVNKNNKYLISEDVKIAANSFVIFEKV